MHTSERMAFGWQICFGFVELHRWPALADFGLQGLVGSGAAGGVRVGALEAWGCRSQALPGQQGSMTLPSRRWLTSTTMQQEHGNLPSNESMKECFPNGPNSNLKPELQSHQTKQPSHHSYAWRCTLKSLFETEDTDLRI